MDIRIGDLVAWEADKMVYRVNRVTGQANVNRLMGNRLTSTIHFDVFNAPPRLNKFRVGDYVTNIVNIFGYSHPFGLDRKVVNILWDNGIVYETRFKNDSIAKYKEEDLKLFEEIMTPKFTYGQTVYYKGKPFQINGLRYNNFDNQFNYELRGEGWVNENNLSLSQFTVGQRVMWSGDKYNNTVSNNWEIVGYRGVRPIIKRDVDPGSIEAL